MLDEKSKDILIYLVKECSNGYKVIEIKDVLSNFKKLDKNYLVHIFKYLDDVGYISIKYNDKKVYCLTVMPYGRQFIEKENIEKTKIAKYKKYLIYSLIIIFLLSILGSILGTFFYNLIL